MSKMKDKYNVYETKHPLNLMFMLGIITINKLSDLQTISVERKYSRWQGKKSKANCIKRRPKGRWVYCMYDRWHMLKKLTGFFLRLHTGRCKLIHQLVVQITVNNKVVLELQIL